MKKYIFLINSICGMGGAQQYCRNKCIELERCGFEVIVYHSYFGDVIVNDLQRYKENLIRELKYFPYCFSRRIKELVIKKITDKINFDDEVIIESSNIANAEWGELVASELRCKHTIFALDEQFEVSEEEYHLLDFKRARKELLCTSKKSIKLMFEKYKKLNDDEAYSFLPLCYNTVDNVPCTILDDTTIPDYYIGVFGRLDKGYVYSSLRRIREYTEQKNKKYCVVAIGGATEKQYYRRIRDIFRGSKNATLVISGFLYPVPRSLLKKMNVIIASAGCATAASKENIPTIYVNSNDGSPVGILNHTIPIGNDYRYSVASDLSLNTLLDDILEDDLYTCCKPIQEDVLNNDFSTRIQEEISRQLSFIKSDLTHEYYAVDNMTPVTKKQKIYYFLGRCFGAQFLDFAHLRIGVKLFESWKKLTS